MQDIAASLVPILTAAVVGIFHAAVLVAFWGYYSVDNPVNDLLLDALLRPGHVISYYAAIFSHDFLLNVLLSIPFALLVRWIGQGAGIKYIGVAVFASLVTSRWSLFANFEDFPLMSGSLIFWASTASNVAAFAVVYFVIAGRLNRASAI